MKFFVVIVSLLLLGLIENLSVKKNSNITTDIINPHNYPREYSYDNLWSMVKPSIMEHRWHSEGQTESSNKSFYQEHIADIAILSAIITWAILMLCVMIVMVAWKLYRRIKKRSRLYEII